MYKEIWERVFNPDGSMKKREFEYFIKTNPLKRIGKPIGMAKDIKFKPGKTLVLLVGASGSGKSTFAQSLGSKAEVISIDYLNLMYVLAGDSVEQAEVRVLNNFEKLVLEAKKQKDIVILDGMFVDFAYRYVILKSFENTFDNIILVFFDVPFQRLMQVDMERTKGFNTPSMNVQKLQEEYRVCQELKQHFPILLLGVDELYVEIWDKNSKKTL